jgi:hypothetical protein
MPATKRFMNWGGVQLGSQTFTGVTQVQFDAGGSLVKFSGDNDRYNSLVVNDFNDPAITVNAADATAIHACPPGTRGVFTATLLDAKNGITPAGGAIQATVTTAVVQNHTTSDQHRQIGDHSLVMATESADGQTNPVAWAAL